MTSSSRLDASGHFLISGINGSRNGDPITALEPTGQAIPGNEGFPVDNLIGPDGSLTKNGLGYETASGNFANPFFADFLNPSDLPGGRLTACVFRGANPVSSPQGSRRHHCNGHTGRSGDALSLLVIHAPQSGILSLHGTSVQYIPPGKATHAPVTFSFDLKDQNGNAAPIVSVIAAGNGSHTLTGAATGYTNISLGNGDNTVTFSGSNNTLTIGSGSDTVHGGNCDTISITGNTRWPFTEPMRWCSSEKAMSPSTIFRLD